MYSKDLTLVRFCLLICRDFVTSNPTPPPFDSALGIWWKSSPVGHISLTWYISLSPGSSQVWVTTSRSISCSDARPHFYQLKRYGLLRYRRPRHNNKGRNNTLVYPNPTIVNYRVDCRRYDDSHNAENLRLTQGSVNFGVLRSVKKLRRPKV